MGIKVLVLMAIRSLSTVPNPAGFMKAESKSPLSLTMGSKALGKPWAVKPNNVNDINKIIKPFFIKITLLILLYSNVISCPK